MLYQIVFHWKSERYYQEFPLNGAKPEPKFRHFRRVCLRKGETLPNLENWSFVVHGGDLDDHQISADCVFLLSKAELEEHLVRAVIPQFADEIEIVACPNRFARMAERN